MSPQESTEYLKQKSDHVPIGFPPVRLHWLAICFSNFLFRRHTCLGSGLALYKRTLHGRRMQESQCPAWEAKKPKPLPEITETPSMSSLIRLPRHGQDLRIESDDQLVTANYNLSHGCLLHLWGANPRFVRDEHHLSQTCSSESVCVFGYVKCVFCFRSRGMLTVCPVRSF